MPTLRRVKNPIRRGTDRGSSFLTSASTLLALPQNAASLAIFRIAVGLVMALEGYALLVPHDAAITSGIPLEHYYTGADITFHWPYEGFEWLPLLSPSVIRGLVGLLCLAGVTMALGLCYRVSVATVFLVWAYLFAVESTRTYWQSHYYLELLLCFLLVWMPAARRYSVDAWRGVDRGKPKTVPLWTLVLLRGQLVIAYFYAGVAKFSLDWFMDAVPVRWFLTDLNVMAPYESLLSTNQLAAARSLLASPQLALALSWTGAIFDVAIGFLLLWRRTRIFGFVLMLVFHGANYFFLFDDIGWFPIVGAATALIFLDPDWPDRVWNWLRRPRIKAPDKWWAWIGGITFPVLGITLGWRLKPTSAITKPAEHVISKRGVVLVIIWLTWQTLLPLRHHFIDGDARFTYEGFSFSWRLKADTRHAIGHSLHIVDAKVISQAQYGRATVDWNAWPYEPCVYRRVQAGRVIWPALPEVAVVLDPLIGERIIYNPYSGRSVSFGPDLATNRLKVLWQQLYGRGPNMVQPLSVSAAIEAMIEACHSAGVAEVAQGELAALKRSVESFEIGESQPSEASATLRKVQQAIRSILNDGDAAKVVRPILRKTYPLALHGEPCREASFFIIDDPKLVQEDSNGLSKIERAQWQNHAATRQPGVPLDKYEGPTPLIVYIGPIGSQAKQLLPEAYVTDVHRNEHSPPRIQWNSLRDMTMSKFMHASAQAFYLRRYARRVATLWEEKCGRRPVVHAATNVSYNGRPHQKLVDPNADLARVPVSWFSHNDWINDLKMARIPRAAVENGGGYSLEKR